MLMRPLLHWFARIVTVHASPESFVFECDGRRLELETRLWVTSDRIEAVGAGGPAGCDPLDLFPARAQSPWKRDLPDLLGAFLQHGICRVLGGGMRLRPIVRVSGLDSFEEILGGYQKAVFAHALEPAGGAEVRFDDPQPGEDV